MTLFKPSYTKNGRLVKSKTWHVRFKDHEGERCRLMAFKDKASSIELDKNVQTLVDRRASGKAIGDLTGWLERCEERIRAKLLEWDIIDARFDDANALLDKHLAEWEAALIARGDTDAHAQLHRLRAGEAFKACGFTRWRDLAPGPIAKWLAEKRQAGLKMRTSNHYVAACRSFDRWMVELEERAPTRRLSKLRGVRVTDEAVPGLPTIEQFRRLLEWLSSGKAPVRDQMDGPTRRLLYWTAAETGLRLGALCSLTWSSFTYQADGWAVAFVEKKHQKNRQDHRAQIRPELAEALRPLIASREASQAPLFWRSKQAAVTLRADLKDAGLPTEDADKRRIKFHSLRHFAGTWLASRGLDLRMVQRVLGHACFAMTADRYAAHVSDNEIRDALSKTEGVACAPVVRDLAETGRTMPEVRRIDDAETPDRVGFAVERTG